VYVSYQIDIDVVEADGGHEGFMPNPFKDFLKSMKTWDRSCCCRLSAVCWWWMDNGPSFFDDFASASTFSLSVLVVGGTF